MIDRGLNRVILTSTVSFGNTPVRINSDTTWV